MKLTLLLLAFLHGIGQESGKTSRLPFPGASGIESFKGEHLVISDNSRFIFHINSGEPTSYHPLHSGSDSVIPKNIKADAEAITSIPSLRERFFIFGSGSLPTREMLFIYYPDSNISMAINLSYFYGAVKQSVSSLNIEAACVTGDTLHLFNRDPATGSHKIAIHLISFIHSLTNNSKPPLQISEINFPSSHSLNAAISGADAIPGSFSILFTASTENTSNPVDDGEIGPSYIGILEPDGRITGLKPLLEGKNIKVEGIAVNSVNGKTIQYSSVTDDDDSTSTIFTGTFNW